MAEGDSSTVEQPIVIKKINKGGGGHHGGAWKVAYADFVTAMMAFFLLLWLLNVTTAEEKDKISNYFDPSAVRVSQTESGAGGVMGGLSISQEGAMTSSVQPLTKPKATGRAMDSPPDKTRMDTKITDNKQLKKTGKKGEAGLGKEERKAIKAEEAKEVLRKQEAEKFKDTERKIREAIEKNPKLSGLEKNLKIDITPEGLRVQIVDQEGDPMFPSGSAKMFEKTRLLMDKVGEIIRDLPNEISIRGHTDGVPYGAGATYTNWELSADRANSSRRVLLESGLPAERIHNVMGRADADHLIPEDPTNPQNRRISIILLKEEITNPEKYLEAARKAAEAEEKRIQEEVQRSAQEAMEAAEETGSDDDLYEDTAPQYDPLLDINIPAPEPVPEDAFEQTPGKVQFP